MTDETNAEDLFDATTLAVSFPGGGRAGASPIAWGLLSDEIERLRQELLARSDVGRISRVLLDHGIEQADESIVAAVKRYNFDSQGIEFTKENYNAWQRLATGQGTVDDARYMVHEIAEVRELQRIQQQADFDYIGSHFDRMTRSRQGRWNNEFSRCFRQAHQIALEVEYDFLVEEVWKATNGRVRLQRYEAASFDLTRDEPIRSMQVDGFPLPHHPNFARWRSRGDEAVEIGSKASKNLGLATRYPTRADLLLYVKRQSLI